MTIRLAEKVKPGMTGAMVYRPFEELWSERNLSRLTAAGRVGHGSGIALTELPSLMAGSNEIILEDMVLHLEPKLEMAGVYQTEEAFRVKENGPEFLSDIAPERLPSRSVKSISSSHGPALVVDLQAKKTSLREPSDDSQIAY
ncbi:M24 family metallopeptidase [Bradyrhizobium sp. RT9a]|uniref:M24 family metallopeptidase n=1 Tax=Bradyrhizobium sp. RT9a TaxID=3156384 RepID=UPI00339472EE